MPNAKHAAAPDPMTPFDFSAVLAANQQALAAAITAREHYLQRWARLNEEVSGFISRRLECDRQTAQELAACRTPQDAYAALGRFYEGALQQYSEEMNVLAQLYVEQAQEAMADANLQASATMDASGARTQKS